MQLLITHRNHTSDLATFDFNTLSWLDFHEFDQLKQSVEAQEVRPKERARLRQKLDIWDRFAKDFETLLKQRDILPGISIAAFLKFIHTFSKAQILAIAKEDLHQLEPHAEAAFQRRKESIVARAGKALGPRIFKRLEDDIRNWEEQVKRQYLPRCPASNFATNTPSRARIYTKHSGK
jgi:hypothetical protein